MNQYLFELDFKETPSWNLRRPGLLAFLTIVTLLWLVVVVRSLWYSDSEISTLIKVCVMLCFSTFFCFEWWLYSRFVIAIRLDDEHIGFWRNQNWELYPLSEFHELCAYRPWHMRGGIWIKLYPAQGNKRRCVHYVSFLPLNHPDYVEFLPRLLNDFSARIEAQKEGQETD